MSKQKLTFQFDSEVACEYGVDAAIFLKQLSQWIYTNRANGVNYREGRTWSKISTSGLQKYFPFWTFKQIRGVRTKCIDSGEIVVQKFSKSKSDQSYWIAFNDEIKYIGEFDYSKTDDDKIEFECPKGPIRQAQKGPSSQAQKGPSSYNINIKRNTKEEIAPEALEKHDVFFEQIKEAYPGTIGTKKAIIKILTRIKPDKNLKNKILLSINEQKKYKYNEKLKTGWTPQWKNLSTWLNQECWTLTFQETVTENIKRKRVSDH